MVVENNEKEICVLKWGDRSNSVVSYNPAKDFRTRGITTKMAIVSSLLHYNLRQIQGKPRGFLSNILLVVEILL